MSDRYSRRAAETLILSLQRAVSCVTKAVLLQQYGEHGARRSITFGDSLVRLRGARPLALIVLQELEAGEDKGTADRPAVKTSGYRYELRHADGPMILAYHWHPIGLSPITTPHLHLGGTIASIDLSKAHLPTGLVTLQDVIRFAIVDLGVEPLREDWRDILGTP